jgi:hypothetical protein
MKRTLLVTFAFVLAAGMAFAYGGMGRGQGMMGGGYGPGACGQCPQYNGQGQRGPQAAPQAVTKDDAQKKVEAFMAANLKGYKIEKTQEFQGGRANMYNFFVKDVSGNKFILRVNPWGNVMGPFVAQQ